MKNFLQGRWLGHPLHPALVHLPTALWPAALIFDLLSQIGGGNNVFGQISFYALAAGLLAALLAVPTGLADWWDIKSSRTASRLGVFHLLLNLLAAGLCLINLGLRLDTYQTALSVSPLHLTLSIIAVGVLLISGYLGGRMVYNYGVSVARFSAPKWRQIAERGGAKLPPA